MWMGIKAVNLEPVKWGNLIDRGSGQEVFKFATDSSNAVGIENRGNDTDALSASGKDFVNVTKIDAADGEPGDGHVCGRPADVIKGDRFGSGLGASGVNGADGDVIGSCRDGIVGLVG